MHIDPWTLALQAINLLVLLALLRWLFYRPLLAVMDARRQALQTEREQAEAARRQAELDAADLGRQHEAAAAAREQLLQAARQQAAAETEASALAARVSTEQCLREAQAAIVRERQQATQALFDEASGLAVELARGLLAQTPNDDAPLLARLMQRLADTPAAEWQTWFAEQAPRRVVLRSAAALGEDRQRGLTEALRAQLGADTEVGFDTDPSLLAGAELCFPHGVLALHWAAELREAEHRWRQHLPATPATAKALP